MNNLYIIDNIDNLDNSFLEYIDNNDKIYFVLGAVLKNKRDFLKSLENFKQVKVLNNLDKVYDDLDFRIIPFLTEVCYTYKNHNIVLVSSNPKLSCLKEYFLNYLGFKINIVPSVQFYKVARYIESLTFIKSFDNACEILFNIIKYKELNIDYISDECLRKKLLRRQHLIKDFNKLAYDFELVDTQLFINVDTTSNCYEKLKNLNLDLDEDSLKRIAYFLHKSDSFRKFKERITSSNNLYLTKEQKENVLRKVEQKIINNDL